MQLDDGSVVIIFDKGQYVVSIMRRTPDPFLQPEPVLNWESFTERAEAAVQDQEGVQHGQLFYPCPVALLACVADQAE